MLYLPENLKKYRILKNLTQEDVEPIYAEFLFGYESGRLAIIAVHLYNAVQDVDFFLVRLNRSAVAIELQRFKENGYGHEEFNFDPVELEDGNEYFLGFVETKGSRNKNNDLHIE